MADPSTVVTVVGADERSHDDEPRPFVDVLRWQCLAGDCLMDLGAGGELTLTFVDRTDIAELNERHLGGVGATDVLSFPLDADPVAADPATEDPAADVPVLLGDIVISPAVAAEQCSTHAGTFEDELALLVVHGVLHLVGYDHADPVATADMRRRELELLTEHHWSGPPPAGFRQHHA
jgi:probable rRNA maturation factor